MPDKHSPSGSDDASAAPDSTAAWSANGSGEAQVAVADAPDAETAETAETAEDLAVPPDAEPTGTIATGVAPDIGSAEPADATTDDGTAFLAKLARAMQATAGAERKRATADIESRREKHLAGIDARRSAEIEGMRRLADGDLEAIDAWANGERQRIDQEREAKAAALRDDLQTSLTEHASRIDREILKVEVAIAAYRAEIENYFGTLDHETDPVVIAQQARRRPAFPALESITVDGVPGSAETAPTEIVAEAAAATAPAEAPTEGDAPESVAAAATDPIAADATDPIGASAIDPTDPADPSDSPGIGVMDPGLSPNLAGALPSSSDASASSVAPEAEPTSAQQTPGESAPGGSASGPEPLKVMAVTSSANQPEAVDLLPATPISRPMSWLRRGSNNDHPNGES